MWEVKKGRRPVPGRPALVDGGVYVFVYSGLSLDRFDVFLSVYGSDLLLYRRVEIGGGSTFLPDPKVVTRGRLVPPSSRPGPLPDHTLSLDPN